MNKDKLIPKKIVHTLNDTRFYSRHERPANKPRSCRNCGQFSRSGIQVGSNFFCRSSCQREWRKVHRDESLIVKEIPKSEVK